MKTIIMVGNLYTGKTTIANLLSEKIGFRILSIDDYRRKFSDGTIEGENKAWDELYKDALLTKEVILDSTGLSKQIKNRIWGFTLKIKLVCIIEILQERRKKEDHSDVPYPYEFKTMDETIIHIQKFIDSVDCDLRFGTGFGTPQETANLILSTLILRNFVKQ